jgi:hypothetical protein
MSSPQPAPPSHRSRRPESVRRPSRAPAPAAAAGGLVASVILGGCASAPSDLAHGLPWTARHEKVSEASVQRLTHHPEIAVDAVSLKEFELAAAESDLSAERTRVLVLLDEAHERADLATRREIARLDDDHVAAVATRHGYPAATDRDGLLAAWRTETDPLYAQLRADVDACVDDATLDALIATLEADAEPSIKQTRYDPGIWGSFAGASRDAADDLWAKEAATTLDRDFAAARSLRVARNAAATPPPASLDVTGATREHWDLLAAWAPRVVQETVDPSVHAASVDTFGRVRAESDRRIEIRTDAPAVYAYAREVPIAGHRHIQLVWTLWYPESVADGDQDAEAGHLEGVTLRATLDPWTRRPILFETLDACGCFHRVYPTRSLDAAARSEYGRPLVPELAAGATCGGDGPRPLLLGRIVADAPLGGRPVIHCAAGNHGIVDVSFEVGDGDAGSAADARDYELLAYDALEHLDVPGGGVTSMFHENGLVKGAQRKEGMYFVPMGILSAGQPRQRGTQLLQFDDWDFDDPDLFPEALAWPHLQPPAATAVDADAHAHTGALPIGHRDA